MSFKIYNNRKTKHPSISIKSGDKKYWHNLEVTHSPLRNERYLEIERIDSKDSRKSYARKYYRKDKHKLKSFLYKNFKLSWESEIKIRRYLREPTKIKKDDVNLISQLDSPFEDNII